MQFAKWTAEGAANTGLPGKYTATQGMRQLPEICQYLAKRTNFVKQGGTAESRILSVLGRFIIMSLSGTFFVIPSFQSQKRSCLHDKFYDFGVGI